MSKELEALESLKNIEEIGKDCLDDCCAIWFNTIKQALIKAQEDEKLKVDICEMFGLDNLFPYNDTKAILKELEEYMDRTNQLWVDLMKTSKQLKEQEKENVELKKVLSIIKEKDVNIWYLTVSTKVKNYKDYNNFLMNDKNKRQLTEEEFNLLKEYLE